MAARGCNARGMAFDVLVDLCSHLVCPSSNCAVGLLVLIFPRLILPLLGEYVDSGYRTPKDRFLYSLRSNGRYQLVVLACAGAGGIYVFLQNGFKGGSVKSLVMA